MQPFSDMLVSFVCFYHGREVRFLGKSDHCTAHRLSAELFHLELFTADQIPSLADRPLLLKLLSRLDKLTSSLEVFVKGMQQRMWDLAI